MAANSEPVDSKSTFFPVIRAVSKDDADFAKSISQFIEAEDRQIEALSKGNTIEGTNGDDLFSEAHTYWANAISDYDRVQAYNEEDYAQFLDASALLYHILRGKDVAWTTEKGKGREDKRIPKYEEEAARHHIESNRDYFSELLDSVANGQMGDISFSAKHTEHIKTLLITLHTVLYWRVEDMRARVIPAELMEKYERTLDRLLDYMLNPSGVVEPTTHQDSKAALNHCRILRKSG